MKNKAVRKPTLNGIVITQMAALSLAIFSLLDLTINPRNLNLDPIFSFGGIAVGVGLGALACFALQKNIERYDLRLVLPIWVSMLTLAIFTGGLFFWLKAQPDMDWRPIWVVALLATLPGSLVGWRLALKLSQDIAATEVTAPISNTLKMLEEETARLKSEYPGSEVQIKPYKALFSCLVKIPRTSQKVSFYIECLEGYPRQAPLKVVVEIELANGTRLVEGYDAPLLYRWRTENRLRDIIREYFIITHK